MPTAHEPSPVRDLAAERLAAMTFAVDLHRASYEHTDHNPNLVVDTAEAIFGWLTAVISLHLTFGPVLDQTTGLPTGHTFGGLMSQLRDTQKVTATIIARDAKGFPVPDDSTTDADNITWGIGDPAVASLTTSPDGRECEIVAGSPGSTVLTATIVTSQGDRSVTHALDVIPGDIAALEISLGEPVDQ